jgi:signal transduction histidine kinase
MRYFKKWGILLSLMLVGCGVVCSGICALQATRPLSVVGAFRDTNLICSFVWILLAALGGRSFALLRQRGRVFAGFTVTSLLAASLGVAFLRLPSPTAATAAFLLCLLLSSHLCSLTGLAVLYGCSVALHMALLYILRDGSALATYAVAGISVSVLGWTTRADLSDWERQSRLFDQARWAASAFVKTNLRMQDRVDRIASLTQTEDRLWMSRELHDSIGYTLTAALAQVIAVGKVITAGSEDDERLVQRLKNVEDMIRETLRDMRRRVSSMRDDAAVTDNGSRRWTRLCQAFADSTGVRVQSLIPPELATVSENVSDAVYRIIQECLTNAYRHGNADTVDVSIAWEPDKSRILLRVSDNGKGAAADVNPGNGLNGMRERVGRLGGELVWQTAPGKGFSVGMEVPWIGEWTQSRSVS